MAPQRVLAVGRAVHRPAPRARVRPDHAGRAGTSPLLAPSRGGISLRALGRRGVADAHARRTEARGARAGRLGGVPVESAPLPEGAHRRAGAGHRRIRRRRASPRNRLRVALLPPVELRRGHGGFRPDAPGGRATARATRRARMERGPGGRGDRGQRAAPAADRGGGAAGAARRDAAACAGVRPPVARTGGSGSRAALLRADPLDRHRHAPEPRAPDAGGASLGAAVEDLPAAGARLRAAPDVPGPSSGCATRARRPCRTTSITATSSSTCSMASSR